LLVFIQRYGGKTQGQVQLVSLEQQFLEDCTTVHVRRLDEQPQQEMIVNHRLPDIEHRHIVACQDGGQNCCEARAILTGYRNQYDFWYGLTISFRKRHMAIDTDAVDINRRTQDTTIRHG